jgi:hypothetical protein
VCVIHKGKEQGEKKKWKKLCKIVHVSQVTTYSFKKKSDKGGVITAIFHPPVKGGGNNWHFHPQESPIITVILHPWHHVAS